MPSGTLDSIGWQPKTFSLANDVLEPLARKRNRMPPGSHPRELLIRQGQIFHERLGNLNQNSGRTIKAAWRVGA